MGINNMNKNKNYWDNVRKDGVWTARASELSKALAQAMNYPSYKTNKAIREGKQKVLLK